MKLHGHGQAKVLSPSEIKLLFSEGFLCDRDRCLFAICLYTGCRISEALALQWENVDLKNRIITLRRETTKGKKHARSIPLSPQLREYLENYQASIGLLSHGFLFPAHHNGGDDKPYLSRTTAHIVLKEACERTGLTGVSTHSMRRTALTMMHNRGIPLSVIRRISGHSSLAALQKYLEVTDEQIENAVLVING